MRKTFGTVPILTGNETPRRLRGPAEFKGQLYLVNSTGEYFRSLDSGPDVEWEPVFIGSRADFNDIVGKEVSTRGTVAQSALDSIYQRFRPRVGSVNLHYTDKPVVVIRSDDSSNADYQVATRLTARNLVGLFAIIWDKAKSGAVDTTTIAQYLEMQRNGHQLAVHSRTVNSHARPPRNFNEFYDEIVTARQEMIAAGLLVDHWVQPGPWNEDPEGDASTYYFNSYAKLDSDIGRILQSVYQTSDAYIQDAMTGNTGGPRSVPAMTEHAANHMTWETGTAATPLNQIDKMIARKQPSSVEFLTHGQRIGASGFISWSEYDAFLDGVAARRDAGKIYVMTETAALLAKPGPRINLFGDESFDAYAVSPAISEWQTATTPPTVVAGESGGSAVRLVSALPGRVFQTVRNVEGLRSLEMVVRARLASGTSPGSLRFLVQYGGGVGAANIDTRYNLTVADGWKTFRVPFGVLKDTTALTIQIVNNTTGSVIDVDSAYLYVT